MTTTPNGSTRYSPRGHAHEEAGRRKARDMRDGETSFIHLTDKSGDSGLPAAAVASYQNADSYRYGFKSMPGQGWTPDKSFVQRVLQHIEGLHMREGAGLGVPVPAGMCIEVAGTMQVRAYRPQEPPPSFISSKMVKCDDPARSAGSTQHTDSGARFPYLRLPGGALRHADDDDDDDDDDDVSDDGDEHDEEDDEERDQCELYRVVLNSGETDVSMWVRVPKYEDGKQVASNRPKGRNEQFQTLEIVLGPGEMFIFLGATGVLLQHQAVLAAGAHHASFVVMDYRFVPGEPSSRLGAPMAALWDGWRLAALSARQARGLRGGEERVLNPHARQVACPSASTLTLTSPLTLNSGHRGREELRRRHAKNPRLHHGRAAPGGADVQRGAWSQGVRAGRPDRLRCTAERL